ncbi:hypothetical protein MPSEU_000487200 [Mayamaea pseudoterrestris]|nr:hypothetical protein MPSEU_000487200 [Mayamaea pseudoterrestris]
MQDDMQTRPSGGFGERPVYETQAYIARPAGDLGDWKDFTSAELNDAVMQSGDKIMEEGIVIVVANTGKIIRRGVGKIPWRQIVDELEEAVRA